MNPEQKAKQLYELFEHDLQFAIYCVEEIIEVCQSYDDYNAVHFSQIGYWKMVKEHLNKL